MELLKDTIISINTTFKVQAEFVTDLEDYLNQVTELISYKVIPDTNKLYKEDDKFKNIVKSIKKLQEIKQDYIYKHNE